MNRNITLALISVMFLPACYQRAAQKKEAAKWRREITVTRKNPRPYVRAQKQQIISQDKPAITIWVHGTTNNPVFRLFHSGPLGFHRMCDIPEPYRISKFGRMLEQKDPQGFCYGHCYIFSWSGDLSFEAREYAARDLYVHIKQLTVAYESMYKTKPFIRLITHSHGGNVALNLAKVCNPKDNIYVDELTLLGCPVQHVTQKYAAHSFFKAVNNIVSEADLLQLGDPQGLYEKTKEVERDPSFFSGRWFDPHKRIVQVRVKVNGRAPFHSEMIFDPFIKTIPAIIAECKTIRAEQASGTAPASAQYLLKINR